MDISSARALLARCDRLTVLSHGLTHPAMSALYDLLSVCVAETADASAFVRAYSRAYQAWLTCLAEEQMGFVGALQSHLLFSDCAFATLCARTPYAQLPSSVVQAGARDLETLMALAQVETGMMLALTARIGISAACTAELPAWELLPSHPQDCRLAAVDWQKGIPSLAAFYARHGTGLFATCPGLTWVGVDAATPTGLRGIRWPDPVALEDLILYEDQRQTLVANTESLLAGRSAANVLLYGDKGTGKSASVKALLSRYWQQGLRIVEIPLAHLTQLPHVFAQLRQQPTKCIVFVDDLAFSDSCPEYTALKTVLEGGLEARPANVVVYATSNRRNIVRQRFSEREDDVNARDTLEEKFSLADRFDLRLTFIEPTQGEFLHIVSTLCAMRGISYGNTVQADALAWTVARGSASPRVARQFVDWLSRTA